jgi:dihydroorotase
MNRGMSAAEQAGVPVMLGATKNLETPLDEQLKRLRAGDVLTYCFYPGDGSIVKEGRVLDCAWDARERGVLFDVGHGVAAFGFEAAEVAIAEGFLPDAISTDYYRGTASRDGGHDLPLVVSELIAAGMTAEQCWPLVTSIPATILGMEKAIGRLEVGAKADLCVLKLDSEPGSFTEGFGQTRTGHRWRPVTTIKAGEIVSSTG